MKKYILAAAVCAAATQASADFIIYADTFGPSLTDFTDTVTLPKFDSRLGDLCGITYYFDAAIDGSVAFDSENPSPSIVKATVSGNITLKDGATTLLSLSPIASSGNVFLAGDSDALPDFIGADGGSFAAVVGGSDSVVVAPGDWAQFIAGPGDTTFTWDIEAEGNSTASGSANLLVFINQEAGGSVRVRYEYNCVVPETSTYLTGLGMLGVAAAAGRRLIRR